MPEPSKYVAHFVNRERQYRGFLKMLAGETRKRIMLVVAPEGMGKTWLVQRMGHECSLQSIPASQFNFRDGSGRDTLKIVRKARDDLGARHYNQMTQVINDITAGPNVDVTIESVAINIQDSTVIDSSITVDDDSAAIRTAVRDNYEEAYAANAQVRALQNARINDAFFACLAAQCATRPAVFLLDGYESAQPEEQRWVEEELLRRVRDDHLPNLIVILTARTVPPFGEQWAEDIAQTGLPAFEEQHIREYIERRNALSILDAHKTFIQLVLDVDANNNPKLLANMVDQYMLKYPPEDKAQEDDSWLL
jgi:hypothetical protein